ncbi:HEPN domain-containing protein [Streptomyces sp. SID2119]|uniref:HEPN domain-containing protein n=1 Tax=Streptomyces sp. SID2119 TaxID=2690253 RepID=UPI0031F66A68
MPSPRYRTLSRRITQLRRNLLPREFSAIGLYSERVYERARAFRVLAHAEFESYIEDRAIEVIQKAHSSWQSSGTIRPSLLSLMAHREGASGIPDAISSLTDRTQKFPTLQARISAEKQAYSTYIKKKNHGIKERNLLRILLPLGVTREEFNTTWLSTTESWATARGEIAHTSASGKMQVQINPRSELATVKEILIGFKQVDKLLNDK